MTTRPFVGVTVSDRGGTLHQDIHAAYQGMPRMRTPLARKRIVLAANSRLAHLMGRGRVAVTFTIRQSTGRALG